MLWRDRTGRAEEGRRGAGGRRGPRKGSGGPARSTFWVSATWETLPVGRPPPTRLPWRPRPKATGRRGFSCERQSGRAERPPEARSGRRGGTAGGRGVRAGKVGVSRKGRAALGPDSGPGSASWGRPWAGGRLAHRVREMRRAAHVTSGFPFLPGAFSSVRPCLSNRSR